MQERNQQDSRLAELFSQELTAQRLILASNRGPIEYYIDDREQLRARRGSGGIVTALSSLRQYVELDWVATAMGRGDREMARQAEGKRFPAPLDTENLYLRFLVFSRSTYHKYYSVISNPLLWFLQHYMWNTPTMPNIDVVTYDAWENGYVPVNQTFAKAIVDEVNISDVPPVIILNDYHLYLAAGYIRRQLPDVVIQHFTHIPWPSMTYWQLLPRVMRQAIFEGLCAADIVGMQTQRDVANFLNCCHSSIEEAEVDYSGRAIHLKDRVVHVKAYPISVDTAGLNRLVGSPRLQEYEAKLKPLLGEPTVVRVDRAEPSKNIIRGFKAFDKFLERYPQYLGKIKFLAFLVPTRSHLRLYQRYAQDIMRMVDAINEKYGTDDWHPVDVFYENNYLQAIVGMRHYDALLVNAVIDGMNLVAKEGPTVNSRDGVLILSDTVGAAAQLGGDAIIVTPTDIEGTTQALYDALTMPDDEKQRRAQALRESIDREDIVNWLISLLRDAASLI